MTADTEHTEQTAKPEPVVETRFTYLDLRCPKCQSTFEQPVASAVNVATHPDARLGILLGTMHRAVCPLCKHTFPINQIFDYYDPERQLVVQVRPEWEFHAGGGEDWYWARYEDLVMKYAGADVRVDVVFGFSEMVEKYLGGQEAVEAARQEWEARRAREASAAEEAKEAGAEG
ncbi:MAG: hypothetical protein IRY97_11900 [Thermomicrobiaceae bacterium]|nr:hypothetical protein [Thermomicrobiaceae bacterium]